MFPKTAAITEIETECGTLYVNTDTKESVLIENDKQITCVSVEDGTLYIDTETHESVLIEDTADSTASDQETAVA